jgi:hypothetical protein
MKLEQQLEILNNLGVSLNENVTIDDFLYSFDRKAYESTPFDLVLFVLGIEIEREPWGRYFSPNVWNFDTECIVSTGDYVSIVKKLCELSGDANYLKDISDFVDIKIGEAWIEYTLGEKKQKWDIEQDDDWADMMTISYIIEDIERDGKSFYYKDNGQAMVLFYLDSTTADKLNELSSNSLKSVNIN